MPLAELGSLASIGGFISLYAALQAYLAKKAATATKIEAENLQRQIKSLERSSIQQLTQRALTIAPPECNL